MKCPFLFANGVRYNLIGNFNITRYTHIDKYLNSFLIIIPKRKIRSFFRWGKLKLYECNEMDFLYYYDEEAEVHWIIHKAKIYLRQSVGDTMVCIIRFDKAEGNYIQEFVL